MVASRFSQSSDSNCRPRSSKTPYLGLLKRLKSTIARDRCRTTCQSLDGGARLSLTIELDVDTLNVLEKMGRERFIKLDWHVRCILTRSEARHNSLVVVLRCIKLRNTEMLPRFKQ